MLRLTLAGFLCALTAPVAAQEEIIASADFASFNNSTPPRFSLGMKHAKWDGVTGGREYGKGMLFRTGGASFRAEFMVDSRIRKATLSVHHLSSLSRACPNNGWSPVAITINGRPVAKGHSPAKHDLMTEEWAVGSFLRERLNTIKLTQNSRTCSNYLLRSFSIRRGPPRKELRARTIKPPSPLAAERDKSKRARSDPSPQTKGPRANAGPPAPIPRGPITSKKPKAPTPSNRLPLSPPGAERTHKPTSDKLLPFALPAGLALLLIGVYWLGTRRSRSTPAAMSEPAMDSGAAEAAKMLRDVGKYRLLSKIGRGGMGEVFVADDRVIGRKVAIKQMRPELASESRIRTRFLQEARIIAPLSHPYIVQLYDVLEDGHNVYLVFEFIDGKPLSEIIAERKRIPLVETVRLMNHACQAVDAAHRARILHRDLKPSNIMVDADGIAKVMDFGIAHLAKESISKLTRKDYSGTPVYMAPEQHMGKAHRASDVYALGVCVYEMLTGQIPFNGPDFYAQKERKIYTPPQYLAKDLPKGIEELIASVLEPDHTKRMKEPMALVEALRTLSNAR